MDLNKIEVLKDISYSIQPCCGLCTNGQFPGPLGNWGTCAATSYEHLKHTGPERQLSIHRFGSCPSFSVDETQVAGLHGFVQFLRNA